ncbi:hypothetical protein MTR67_051706 [Solanum verrucosum]|uniref:Uncharacterized protein n=1 Tax=Solanum verrucosum TaxID=315347 RepID=A0AAF1A0C9_SOLVR|nr:hypothetical protein MTR67_051706 [Solanum verrucosum]
MVLEGQLRPR